MADYTGGHSTALSPDAFQKAINAVVYEKYMRDDQPDALNARDPFFFKQSQGNEMVYLWDEDSNVGSFLETEEQADVVSEDTFIGNTKSVRQRKFMKQIPVSFEAMKTEQVGINKRAEIGTQIADRARLSQDKFTIADTYADAFAGAISTTPDGDAWASDSHTTLKGANVDNLGTPALTADGLWTMVQQLANQKAQDGELGGQVFEGIVVPFILLKKVHETLDSDLIPFSGENQVNIFQTIYGSNVRIKASVFLGSTYNANSNANTSYHVVSSNVQANRKTLVGLSSSYIPETMTTNDTAVMRSKFMETHFVASWFGSVHSNGTT